MKKCWVVKFQYLIIMLFLILIGSNNVKAEVRCKQLAASGYSSLLLDEKGYVWTWGTSSYGQIDYGMYDGKMVPRQVTGLSDVKHIANSDGTMYAIKGDGTIWKWGLPLRGKTEQGYAVINEPVQVFTSGELNGVEKIVGNGFMNFAIKKDGSLYAWGDGCFGNGKEESSKTPILVKNIENVKDVRVFGNIVMVLKKDKTVWMWGNNNEGQLGDGTYTTRKEPVKVKNINDIVSIDTNGNFCLAADEKGNVYAWGSGNYAKAVVNRTNIPNKIPDLKGIIKVCVGKNTNTSNDNYAIEKLSNGSNRLWGWGGNNANVLLRYDNSYSGDVPVTIAVNPIEDIELYYNAFAIGQDGKVYTWGSNRYNTLGRTDSNALGSVEFRNNTSFEEALEVSMYDEISDEISQQSQYRYYSFVPEVTSKYCIESFSNIDMYGYIYDESFNVIKSDDDGNGEGTSENNRDFYIKQELEKGKRYFIGVRCFNKTVTGAFRLSIQYWDDYGNDANGAYDINTFFDDNSSKQNSSALWSWNGEINYGGEEDYFKVTPKESGLFSVESLSTIDMYGSIYEKNGTGLKRIAYNDDRGTKGQSTNIRDFYMEYWLEKGTTYYISIRHYSKGITSIGKYSVIMKQIDDADNTLDKSLALSKNIYSGRINYSGDIDCYKITPSVTAVFSMQSISQIDTHAILYDANMNELAKNDDGYSKGESTNSRDFYMEYWLEAGETYYVRIKHFSSSESAIGDYTFRYLYLDDFENDISSAKKINMKNNSFSYGGRFDYVEDIDIFEFVPSNNGAYEFFVESNSGIDTYGVIYDSYGNVLIEDDNTQKVNHGNNSAYSSDYYMATWLEKGKKYYVSTREKNGKITSYGIRINYINGDIGNSIGYEGDIGSTEIYNSKIDYFGDVDMIKIVPNQTGEYTIESYSTINLKCALYNAQTVMLAENDDDNNILATSDNKLDFCIKYYLQAGSVYYLKVEGKNKPQLGNYGYAMPQKGEYELKIRRRFTHVINTYFDRSFAVRQGDIHNIEENLKIMGLKLDKIFKRTINCEMIINDPIEITSSADECKIKQFGEINKGNIDAVCPRNGVNGHVDCTNPYIVYERFIKSYPGSVNTTSSLWTGNALYIVDKDGKVNRSFSYYDYGIFMQELFEGANYFNIMLPPMVHEIAHQIHAADHYHEDEVVLDENGKPVLDANGNTVVVCKRLKNNEACMKCTGASDKCIMSTVWWRDLEKETEEDIFCEVCVNGIRQYLLQTH